MNWNRNAISSESELEKRLPPLFVEALEVRMAMGLDVFIKKYFENRRNDPWNHRKPKAHQFS